LPFSLLFTKNFTLFWFLLPFLGVDKEAVFTITAQTAGWVGFGLSDTPSMPNSDAIVGWVDDKSLLGYAYDMWIGPHREQPSTDVKLGGTSDIQLISSAQSVDSATSKSITTLTFKRKFSTKDKYDIDLADRNYYVLWYAFCDMLKRG